MKHLTRLIDDLLDVSRISRGKIALRRDVFDMTPIIESAVATVKPLIEERKHTLHVSIDRGNLWVNADPTRLEQVVVNLLNNAAKYSENEGHVWAHGSQRRARRSSSPSRTEGSASHPRNSPKMFELFAQGDRSLARSEGGLGHRAYHRQETRRDARWQRDGGERRALQGKRVHDSPARGRKPIRPPAARRHEPREHAGKKFRILVVDDRMDTARGMARILNMLGHEVATAHTRSRGAQCGRNPPSRLHPSRHRTSGDERLRGGLPAEAREVRHRGFHRRRIRLRPGGGHRRSKAAGFDHHLIKPLDLEALISLLSTRDTVSVNRETAGK